MPFSLDRFFDGLIRFFTSMKLAVVCLGLALVLVFFGTIRQVDLGLYKAQNEYFRSFLIWWGPHGASWKVPVFPGGYLIGGVLLLNLIASQLRRFVFTASKIGLWMVHVGLILLLLGQLLTDLLSSESILHLREGEARNYSLTEREAELAVMDVTDPTADKVVSMSQRALAPGKEIRTGNLPFTVRVKQFFPNSVVAKRAADAMAPPPATQGIGPEVTLRELPRVTETDKRDVPSAVVEIATPQNSLGTWLVSEYVEQPQAFTLGNRTFALAMRPLRHYKPYSIELLKFQHDLYPGTDIPKNFASRVLLQRPDTGEKREVLIYMNNPLRYAGETYYQSGWDPDDRGTILQVVHNPSWLTPYLSCVLVGVGLMVHFATHLLGFARKRRVA
jgi:hypothetical protein